MFENMMLWMYSKNAVRKKSFIQFISKEELIRFLTQDFGSDRHDKLVHVMYECMMLWMYNRKCIRKETIHSIYLKRGLNRFLMLDFGLSRHTFSSACMFLNCTDKYDADSFRFIYPTALWTVAMESQYFGGTSMWSFRYWGVASLALL